MRIEKPDPDPELSGRMKDAADDRAGYVFLGGEPTKSRYPEDDKLGLNSSLELLEEMSYMDQDDEEEEDISRLTHRADWLPPPTNIPIHWYRR